MIQCVALHKILTSNIYDINDNYKMQLKAQTAEKLNINRQIYIVRVYSLRLLMEFALIF